MKGVRENLATVITAFYAWSMLLVSFGLIYTAFASFSVTSLRELALAFIILFPLRNLYAADIPVLASEWFDKNRIPTLIAVTVVSVLNLGRAADFYNVILGYYGFIHQSLSSVFLRSMLVYQNIFGTFVSELIFNATTFYIEVLLAYVLIKPVYFKLKQYGDEKDG